MKSIGITLGDLSGINGEIVVKSICELAASDFFEFNQITLIGCKQTFVETVKQFIVPAKNYSLPQALAHVSWCEPKRHSIDLNQTNHPGFKQFAALDLSVNLLKTSEIGAIVNCPINKLQINTYLKTFLPETNPFVGQTEFYARAFDKKHVIMSFLGHVFNVALLSNHLALSQVETFLTKALVQRKLDILIQALKLLLRKEKLNLQICSLNPHGGEGGLFGSFDEQILAPVIHTLQSKSIQITGPSPADSTFFKLLKGRDRHDYDMVVTMYHDQGLIPFKLIHFDTGVNITLGLDFIRTSTDHGPAYDIAFKNIASHQSLLHAIKTAGSVPYSWTRQTIV